MNHKMNKIAIQNYKDTQRMLDHKNRQNRRYNSDKFIDWLTVYKMSENITKN